MLNCKHSEITSGNYHLIVPKGLKYNRSLHVHAAVCIWKGILTRLRSLSTISPQLVIHEANFPLFVSKHHLGPEGPTRQSSCLTHTHAGNAEDEQGA